VGVGAFEDDEVDDEDDVNGSCVGVVAEWRWLWLCVDMVDVVSSTASHEGLGADVVEVVVVEDDDDDEDDGEK
jgi:hypothetical protein